MRAWSVWANRIRPASGIGRQFVALPSRQPDAVAREPEHLRRAREVIGMVDGEAHGRVLPRARIVVVPNKQTHFGGIFG